MSNKEDILKRYRANVREKFDMPDLSDIKAITYPDPLVQFIKMTESVGGHVIELKEEQDINAVVKELYPDAKEIASNLPEITIATRNPDTVGSANDLNGTDVGHVNFSQPESSKQNAWHTLSGHPTNSPQLTGIYIHNRRKVAVR